MGPRVLGFLFACLVCAGVHAQLTIAGSVYEDRPALALRQNFRPAAGVTVKLYRDGGDRVPTPDDAQVATATTNAAGIYGLRAGSSGDYWVVVDSRSLRGGAIWAEQTFGPSGALCAHPDGTAQASYFEGPCFGGRTAASDDASTLVTSEHVAGVTLRENATDIDFAFSFDVVTSTADGERVQGSLRQFVTNANAIEGPNRMRFVPLVRAPEQRETIMGVPPRWWSILLASPLPEITGEGTTIDGTAYSYLSPASVANVHPGRLGEAATIRPGEVDTVRQEKPELEVVASGAAVVVCNASCAVRALSLHGSTVGVRANAPARIEHVMIGAAPDGVAATTGDIGVRIEKDTTVMRFVLVASQASAGIHINAGAHLDAERLDVSHCGQQAAGGGIVVLSDGSSIRSSLIAANGGAGIVLGAMDGSRPASSNTVDGCTISSNLAGIVLAPGSSRNVITRNDIMWNRLGGVTVAPFPTNAPRENRISANRFDENGLRPVVLDTGVRDPNLLRQAADNCTRLERSANGGISPPRVESVRVAGERVIIRGRACPGDIVELYQSYVTSGVREETARDLPKIRKEQSEDESLTTQTRTLQLPSIGEFNYLGATSTNADGSFEATFPFPALLISDRTRAGVDQETAVWAEDVLRSAKPEERAFSAMAIDAGGNTSEMSVRRKVD